MTKFLACKWCYWIQYNKIYFPINDDIFQYIQPIWKTNTSNRKKKTVTNDENDNDKIPANLYSLPSHIISLPNFTELHNWLKNTKNRINNHLSRRDSQVDSKYTITLDAMSKAIWSWLTIPTFVLTISKNLKSLKNSKEDNGDLQCQWKYCLQNTRFLNWLIDRQQIL